MPVANETLGSFAPMALSFIKELGKRIADINGDKRSAMFLFQKIGIATQQGNAASIFGTFSLVLAVVVVSRLGWLRCHFAHQRACQGFQAEPSIFCPFLMVVTAA